MIYVPILKSENLKNLGNRWQINNASIAKIDCMFLITDLQSCYKPEKSIRHFFIVEIIDFFFKKRLHTLIATRICSFLLCKYT